MSSHRERADIAAYRALHPDATYTRARNAVRAGWRRPNPDPHPAEQSTDPGGILAMLDHAHHHLAAAGTRTPAVLVLAHAHRAVTAISVAGSLLTVHCVPTPEHHPPIVDAADQLDDRIAPVIGDYLRLRHSISGARPADPMLYWAGPNLHGTERRMLRISEHMQRHCDRVARDETVPPDQRRAAAHTVDFTAFLGMQLGGPVHWLA